jgi:Family of unknown function (DUF6941)
MLPHKTPLSGDRQMPRIDGAVICDRAFLDREDRLCLIGVIDRFTATSLPLAIKQAMLVARIVDVQPIDEVEVAIGIIPPGGLSTPRTSCSSLVIEMAGQYVLVTLRGLPLTEEGVYRFQILLNSRSVTSIDIPVQVVDRPSLAVVHSNARGRHDA